MNMRKNLYTLAAVVALTLLASACGVAEQVGAGDDNGDGAGEQTLLLGHGADAGNPRSIAAEQFAETVSERTDGRLTVQIQGSEQLGSDVEMLQSVEAGTLDMTANSQGPLSGWVPEVALFGLPFLFESTEDAYEVLDGDIGEEIAALGEEEGFVILAWWDNGIRHVTNNARPIETPDDVAGLQIRTPEDPMTVDIFEELGANPTPIDFGELYLALQQGTVDGQENPLVNIWASDLYEVQEYLSTTGHKYEVTPFIIGADVWASLSEEDQQVVREAAEEARDLQRDEMASQTVEIEEDIQEHLELNRPDPEPFREATSAVYDKWREDFGDLVDRLQDAAQ